MFEVSNYQLPTTNYFRKGFTLIELVIFAAIFTVATIAFTTILLATLQIQVRQGNQADVSQQSQFLLQKIQYYIERASLIDIPQDSPTTTLKLWLGVGSQDPTYITLTGGTVYLQQTATGTLQALTSNKVAVSNLSFVRRTNPPGHDAVNVAFSMAYSSANANQIFTEALQTTVARVSAATFDSSVLPSSTATYSLGTSGAIWNSINGVINFSSSTATVGIGGAAITGAQLDVYGTSRVDGGDVYVYNNTNGLILKDASNACWRIRVATSGALSTSGVGCP